MEVNLLTHQAAALKSEHKYTALISGIGAGKTWTGVHWVIKRSQSHPKSLGFIGANTFGQLRNSTLAAVFGELTRLSIPFSYNQSSGILEVMGKRWLCKSMDNFDVLRGIEVGEIWLDECAYMKEEGFKVIMGRLRDNRGSLTMFLTSTPKGYNWCYHYLHPEGDNKLKDSISIKAHSSANKFLPDGYLESLESQFDSKLLAQELSGDFINVSTGVIYYAFSREVNVGETKLDPRFPIWVGMDFNPHKMSAVIGQVIGGVLYIIDEIFDTSPGSNTEKVSRELIRRYGERLTIVPDSTGKKATSNASKSDIQILRDYGFTLKLANNPFRVDRYAAVNSSLSKQKVVIGKHLRHLPKDLESVSYKEGTDKPDVSDPNHGHMSDAFGYLVFRTVNPIIKSDTKVTIHKR
jgi:phage terminase large subunit